MSKTILVGSDRSFFVIIEKEFGNAKVGDIVSIAHMDNQKFSGFSNKGYVVGNCPVEYASFPEKMCKTKSEIGKIGHDEWVAIFPIQGTNDCKMISYSGEQEIVPAETVEKRLVFMCSL